MEEVNARAFPRAGLLGNPSDLFGGSTLAFTFDNLEAQVTLHPAETTNLPHGILSAGWEVFSQYFSEDSPTLEDRPFSLSSETTIPRQVGLAGSSALLIAALRAWSQWFEHPLPDHKIAEMAWQAETEILGLKAGPMDRLTQAYGGLIAIDGSQAFQATAVTRMDQTGLPPLLIAWSPQPGKDSGDVHKPVAERWERGDAQVILTVEQLDALTKEGISALEENDSTALASLMDRNFDLRASLYAVSEEDQRMVSIARDLGAAAKLCGSGGAVLVLPSPSEPVEKLEEAFASSGFFTLIPHVAQRTTSGGESP